MRTLPPNSEQARSVQQVIDFAQIAIENLGLSDKVLAAVGQPLAVKRTVIAGHRTPLDAFAVSVSVTVSLMFITVLLASGMLALEREEHAFGRLVRGLVSRLALLGEKVVLAATCAFAVTLVMLLRHRDLRAPRLGPLRPLAGRPRRRRDRLRARWASRSAHSPARCAPRRCWPSC